MSAAPGPFLVEAEALRSEIGEGDVLVIDARKPADYAQGHIPDR
jgi:rhodanese-related sulfurtransferase